MKQPEARKNLIPENGEVFLYPHFFSAAESDFFLETLRAEVNWRQEPILLFGKKILQPRLTAWHGDLDKAYSYSGITMRPEKWTPTLLEIKRRIEPLSGVQFTSALLNLYRNENDSMGWHRDNEKALGKDPVIGSVSLGDSRIFQLRKYREKNLIQSLELGHGSFLLMRGRTQSHWEHRVAKVRQAKAPRINITFRVLHC